MPDYRYDAFISYSSKDRDWAARLEDDLRREHLKMFRDESRLQAGDYWEPELYAALEESEHLVVFWSGAAKESDWVRHEIASFLGIVRQRGAIAGSRVIAVMLEGEYKVLASQHLITDLRRAGAYATGFANLNESLWRSVTDRVVGAIRTEDNRTPIPVALITITESLTGEIVLPAPLLEKLGIVGQEALLASYGSTRRDWHPFGSEHSVGVILDRLQDEINDFIATASGTPFRWDDVTEAIWSADDAEVSRALAKFTRPQEPAVLVIDPIALRIPKVANRLTDRMHEVLENDSVLLAVLTPFALPASIKHLRDELQQIAWRVYETFYRPPLFRGRPQARCGPSVADEVDLKGWVMATLGPHVASRPERRSSAFTRTRV